MMIKEVGKFKNYRIFLSDREPKKYYALVNGKKVYFGDRRYQQYYDKMNHYTKLNHNDENRRRLYYARHGKDAIEGTAKWFSHNILW